MLSEWVKRFGLVQTKIQLCDTPVITHDVANEELSLKQSLLLQTARKRKAMDTAQLQLACVNPEVLENVTPENSLSPSDILAVLRGLSSGVTGSVDSIKQVHQALIRSDLDTHVPLLANEERWKDVLSQIGEKPQVFHAKLEGPTIWSTISLMASNLNKVSLDVEERISK